MFSFYLIIYTNFNELMRDTLATQDAVFEAEKKILSKKQTKKVKWILTAIKCVIEHSN